MKKLRLLFVLAFIVIATATKAQVSVNVNLGTPPVWGPTVTTEEYYFLPDINSYYDIRTQEFIYLNRGVWSRNRALPRMYRGYNFKTGNIVVLSDYRGRSPYANFKNHKIKYYKGAVKMKGGNYKENSQGRKHDNGNGHGNGHGRNK